MTLRAVSTRSAALISRPSASATSEATSAARRRLVVRAAVVRPAPSRRSAVTSAPAPVQAGSHPATTPQTAPAASAHPTTTASIRMTPKLRRNVRLSSGIDAVIQSAPYFARARPTALAATKSTTCSTSHCCTIRPREAPSARRTAISCRRAVARASMTLVTLTQAMSSTQHTIAKSTGRRNPQIVMDAHLVGQPPHPHARPALVSG